MKIEKRGEVSEQENTTAAVPEQAPGKHKPVLVYLVILFAIAFLLIIASFAMNQHSNDKVLQELQGQVETLQQLQNTEEKYHEAMAKNEELKQQIEELTLANKEAAEAHQALELVWQLENLYADGKLDECRSILSELKKDDLYLLLPPDTSEDEKAYPSPESPAAAFRRIDAALNPAAPSDNADAPANNADKPAEDAASLDK